MTLTMCDDVAMEPEDTSEATTAPMIVEGHGVCTPPPEPKEPE